MKENLEEKYCCPICSVELRPNSRYPRYVCQECKSKATDESGRALGFGNIDMSGGFVAKYRDTNEMYDSHTCYIDGIECFANEARFGGVVVEKCNSENA